MTRSHMVNTENHMVKNEDDIQTIINNFEDKAYE